MVVLCKSSAGLRFYFFIHLYLFIYLCTCCLLIYHFQNWEVAKTKQYMGNFKTITYWANWRLFYVHHHHARKRRDSTWAGHLKPHEVKKCWSQPPHPAPDSLQTWWCSFLWPGLPVCWRRVRVTDGNRSATSDDSASPSELCHRDSGGGGFPRALPLRACIQMFRGTSSLTCNLLGFFSSGILESRCSTGIERDFLCAIGFILIKQMLGGTFSQNWS